MGEGELSLLKGGLLDGKVCRRRVGFVMRWKVWLFIVEEGVEVGRLRGLGSRFLEVVLAGLRSRSKVVGLSSFAGWWGENCYYWNRSFWAWK